MYMSEISTDFHINDCFFKDDKKKKFPFSLGGSAKKIELHIPDSRRAEVINHTGVCSSPKVFFLFFCGSQVSFMF